MRRPAAACNPMCAPAGKEGLAAAYPQLFLSRAFLDARCCSACVCSHTHTWSQNVTLGGTGKDMGDRHPKIAKNVLIGANATILGNIVVGEGAQIAAGSLVLKPVEPHTIVGGSPAKPVGKVVENPALTMLHWRESRDKVFLTASMEESPERTEYEHGAAAAAAVATHSSSPSGDSPEDAPTAAAAAAATAAAIAASLEAEARSKPPPAAVAPPTEEPPARAARASPPSPAPVVTRASARAPAWSPPQPATNIQPDIGDVDYYI
eukprot:363292-Chlamydomonas_euryale.AAC.10